MQHAPMPRGLIARPRVSARVLAVIGLAIYAVPHVAATLHGAERGASAAFCLVPSLLSQGGVSRGLSVAPNSVQTCAILRKSHKIGPELQMVADKKSGKKKGQEDEPVLSSGGEKAAAGLPNAAVVDWKGLEMMGADWLRYGPEEDREGAGSDEPLDPSTLPPPRWYIVQCNPGLVFFPTAPLPLSS
jgi:hypothetical protein